MIAGFNFNKEKDNKILNRLLEEKYRNEDEFILWEKYKKNKDPNIREYFIVQYSPLVKKIAGKIKNNLSENIEYDDLVSCGNIGLLDAIEKFQPEKKNKFITYATFRIRGQVWDELRSEDWVPRDLRKKSKDISKIIQDLKDRIGKNPSEEQIAKELKMSLEELQKWRDKFNNFSIFELDKKRYKKDESSEETFKDTLESSHDDQDKIIEKQELKKIIYDTIKSLPEKEKVILVLYYYEDLGMKEIGEVLKLTGARISQIRKKALLELKVKLTDIIFN